MQRLRDRHLTQAEARAFAESALLLRYDNLRQSPVTPETLLQGRRAEDAGDNLWATLNRVQENLLRGGIRDEWRRQANGNRFYRMRPIKGIDRNITLNKALWRLAESVAEGQDARKTVPDELTVMA